MYIWDIYGSVGEHASQRAVGKETGVHGDGET